MLFSVIVVHAQNNGETTFKQVCAACHTIGGGSIVGPDLADVQNRVTEDWFIKFVKSSQTVIKSGDKYADSLFKAYHQIQMPDHPTLTDDQIKEILVYIKEKSLSPEPIATTVDALQGDSKRGKELFIGTIRFANQGAACNSCHNVDMKGLISGGALGKDLTQAITRLSEKGVSAIITGLPFPQMKETYASMPVTEQEVADLTAFLTTADNQAAEVTTFYVGDYLLMGGAAGIIILLVLYSIFWIRRKKEPVNFFIFNRQIKSV